MSKNELAIPRTHPSTGFVSVCSTVRLPTNGSPGCTSRWHDGHGCRSRRGRSRSGVIHRILVDGVRFRTAAVDHDVEALNGVRIGTTDSWFLAELKAQDNS